MTCLCVSGALLGSRFHLAFRSSDSDFPIRRKSDLGDLHERLNLDNGILEYPPMNKRQETHFEWHDGLDLCSRLPRIMHAPELSAPTPTKGSAASHACDVSMVHRESLPIIILHSLTPPKAIFTTLLGRINDRCRIHTTQEDCKDARSLDPIRKSQLRQPMYRGLLNYFAVRCK